MARELSPGLKILWVWTLGTAAVLVTSVVRTRVRDMENLMNAEQQQQQPQHNTATDTETLLVDTSPQSSELIREEKP
ncbi:uncharacterized protein Pyn_39515 [Prunus yedoensis var. nudiflora]|uniref:Uncharacterized protein n=1 Tax=Prunus yedoensis var. nudiflora TaxID=2094558 RepID=A0A314Z9V7_PRUYE|nr:uncharacterized protein Pyn_41006 [Prunus yedoensis var. nudiflora]PQQ14817.1 uncharacterized protein Pyn_39515 [Prunus yedoensis var. nudiflora]